MNFGGEGWWYVCDHVSGRPSGVRTLCHALTLFANMKNNVHAIVKHGVLGVLRVEKLSFDVRFMPFGAEVPQK